MEAGAFGPHDQTLQFDERTGAFRFSELSPGRYVLGTNFEGPTSESPYAPKFYPSGSQRAQAVEFDLAEGQHIKGMNMTLTPLPTRNLNVNVTRSDGQPLPGALIKIAYEHSPLFDTPNYVSRRWVADAGGNAQFHVFGDSRIRVWAQSPQPYGESRYSPIAEIQGPKLPTKLALVVSATPRLAP